MIKCNEQAVIFFTYSGKIEIVLFILILTKGSLYWNTYWYMKRIFNGNIFNTQDKPFIVYFEKYSLQTKFLKIW